MARRFDVFENPSPRLRHLAPYVVVLQSHFLEGLPSVIVAPLLIAERAERFAHLSIEVRVANETLVVSLHELAAVDERSLRAKVGDVTEHQDKLDRGLQRLFTGF